MTVISGLEGFDVKLKEAASKIGKKFGTGASVTKSATGESEITLQGDKADDVRDILMDELGIPEEAIIIKD